MLNYHLGKKGESDQMKEFFKFLPWRFRLALKFMPKNFSKVKDMKKMLTVFKSMGEKDRHSIGEYLENISKTDEHYMKEEEDALCWGFENVGTSLHLGVLQV